MILTIIFLKQPRMMVPLPIALEACALDIYGVSCLKWSNLLLSVVTFSSLRSFFSLLHFFSLKHSDHGKYCLKLSSSASIIKDNCTYPNRSISFYSMCFELLSVERSKLQTETLTIPLSVVHKNRCQQQPLCEAVWTMLYVFSCTAWSFEQFS